MNIDKVQKRLIKIGREDLAKEYYLKISKAPNKSEMIRAGKHIAEEVVGNLAYKAKEYFGDWPDDVVGKDMSKIFWKALSSELIKLIKRDIK